MPTARATLVVTGGGTGGHVFPAIAIAQAVQARRPDVQPVFVGGSAGMEMQLVPQANIPTHGVTIAGLYRQRTLRNLWRNLGLPFKVLRGYWQARRLVAQLRPAVVVGTGGYASLPALYAATHRGIPIVLTEQNAYPGLVNRRLAARAAKILLGNADAAAHFGRHAAKCVVTGNPIRQQLLAADPAAARAAFGLDAKQPVLLVLGGSLGARTLNQALAAGLDALGAAGVQVVWQCGKLYAAQYAHLPAQHPHLRLVPFVADMAAAYAAADLVVSRAGAISVSELAALGKPSILVPSPNVADDHQTGNARSLADRGAARLVPDREAAQRLVPEAIALLADPAALQSLRDALAALPRHDAAARMAAEIEPYLPPHA